MTEVPVIFVTPELEPLTGGGAGVVVAGIAGRLDGSRIIVATDRRPSSVPAGVLLVDLPPADGSVDWYLSRSRRMAEALADMVASGPRPALVEFTDFEAPAWWALTHRHALGLTAIPIAVRLHGPVDAIVETIGVAPPPLDVLAEVERAVFAMADVVIVPSDAIAAWLTGRYGVDTRRVVVSSPPVPDVTARPWRPTAHRTLAFFGRLTEAKGIHDLAAAVVPLLDEDAETELVVIGDDGWSIAEQRPMSDVIADIVPARHRRRVTLTGRLEREAALDRLASAWVVVVPSRFESFCLAAHEARRSGPPLVLPALPAFAAFRGHGAVFYDGSVAALTARLASLDLSALRRLAAEPPPDLGHPLAAYRSPLPAPRHPDSQAAAATAAVHRLEELTAAPPPPGAGAARRLLRVVPQPVARAAVRLLPRRVKDRFRRYASWPAEEARRHAEERRQRVVDRIAAGDFDDLDGPAVSVVVPCYDQGRWVTEAVLSVFEQTAGSWEVILVDDGSTDEGTISVLAELERWPRVTLVSQENRGLPAARNAGMARARGGYLVPLDADDELAPAFLETMTAALDAAPAAGYAHCWGRYFGAIDGYWITRPFNPYQMLLSNSVLGCVVMRTAAWRSVGGYDEAMRCGNEDWDLWLRMLEGGWSEVEVRAPLFRYRRHGRTMSVDTLVGLEEARLDLRDRHPALYAHDTVTATKARWYPWVTVMRRTADGDGVAEGDLTDREEIATDGDVVGALHATRGKVVVDWDLLFDPEPGTLRRIAEALEAVPSAACAVADGVAVAWRRWALHDPGAPLPDTVAVEVAVRGAVEPQLEAGIAPLVAWMAPDGLPEAELAVTRQPPEVEGPLPDWL